MSKTVDERVVQMEFDNADFEKNVETSIETLEKLQQALKLDDATTGFDSLNASIKETDFSSIAEGVESLEKRFSNLGIVGMEVLQNLTDSAMNLVSSLGSKLTSSIVSGGITRAMNIENARFMLQGLLSDEAEVEAVMDNVSAAVDGTAYSMDQAAMVASQLVASGMSAGEEMESTLKAVAGVAAMTNSEYSEIGNIFTTVAGNGKLMTQQLRQLSSRGLNAAATIADYLGTTEAAVREMVSDGEISFQTFSDAMDSAFGEHAKDANKTFTGAMANIKSACARIGQKFAEPLVAEGSSLVEFFNTLREKINEVNEQLDPLADLFVSVVETIVNWGSKVLGNLDLAKPFRKLSEALGTPFQAVSDRINSVTTAVETVETAVTDFSDVVNKVIGGEFGNGADRINALTEAGYDWAYIQNLVNEQLGDSTRHETDFVAETEEVSESVAVTIEELCEMSDAELENLGFTEDEIDAFHELAEQSKKTGISIESLIEDTDQLSGQTLILNGLKNIGQSLVTVFQSLREAFRDIFPGTTVQGIYDAIAAFHKFTTYLTISDETAEKLTRTFRGLFAAIDLVYSILKSGFHFVVNLVSKVLDKLGLTVLDVTANLGDLIVKFRDFVKENEIVDKILDALSTVIVNVVKGIKSLYDAFMSLPFVQSIVEKLKEKFEELKDADWGEMVQNGIDKLKNLASTIKESVITAVQWLIEKFEDLTGIDLSSVGSNIIEGFENGLSGGLQSIPELLKNIGLSLLDAIKNVLGIHSPSTEMYEVGENTIEGLENGVSDSVGGVQGILQSLGNWIIEFFSNLDIQDVINIGIVAGLVYLAKKIFSLFNAFSSITDALTSVKKVLGSLGDIEISFANLERSAGKFLKYEGIAAIIKSIALAFIALAGAVALLANLDSESMWSGVGAIAVLAILLGALTVALMEFSSKMKATSSVKFASIGAFLLELSASLLVIAGVVAILGNMDEGKMTQGVAAASAMLLGLTALIAAISLITKSSSTGDIAGLALLVAAITVALIAVTGVIALAGMLQAGALLKGSLVLAIFLAFILALTAITKLATSSQIMQLAVLVMAVSAALVIIVAVIAVAGLLSGSAIAKGLAVLVIFAAFIAVLVLITKISSSTQMMQLGVMVLAVSAALVLMVGVVALCGLLSWGAMAKGAVFVAVFLVFLAALVGITKIGSDKTIAKVSGTLLSVSLAIAMMAVVAALLGMLSVETLVKGVAAVAVFAALIDILLAVSKNAGSAAKTVLALTAAIAVMALAIGLLASFTETSDLITATASLGAIMLAMVALIAVVGKLNVSTKDLVAIGVLTLVIAAIAAILYLLRDLDTGNALGVATGISEVLLAMSVSLAVMSSIKSVSSSAYVALLVMVGTVALLAVIFRFLLSDIDPTAILPIATALSETILALSAAMLLICKVPVKGAAKGALALDSFIGILGGLMVAIGWLNDLTGGTIEKFIDEAIPIFTKLGEAIGGFVGGIIGGIAMGTLEGIGLGLSGFMDGASDFIDGCKSIDGSVLEGASILAATILELTATSFISGIASLFGLSFDSLGESLSDFGYAVVDFSNIVSGKVDADAVQAAASAGDMVASLYDSLPKSGGWAQKIFGESMDFDTFSTQMVTFGDAIVTFSDHVAGKVDKEGVEAAEAAGETIAALYDCLPKGGGWAQKIFGESMDLDEFGRQLLAFGDAVVTFSDHVKGKVDNEAVEAAEAAGETIAALYDCLPKGGGWAQKIFGESMDLEEFGRQLLAFGDAIVEFSGNVAGNVDSEAVNAAESAGKTIASLYDCLPQGGGWSQKIFGEGMDLDEFGRQLLAFGDAIVGFSKEVTGNIDESAVTVAESAGETVSMLYAHLPQKSGWVSGLFGGSTMDLDEFGKELTSFGSAIVAFCQEVSGNVSTADASLAKNAAAIVTDLYNYLPSDSDWTTSLFGGNYGLDTFGDELVTFGTAMVNFMTVIHGNLSWDDAQDFGTVVQAVWSGFALMDTSVAMPELTDAITSMQQFADLMEALSGISAEDADNFIAAMDKLVEINLTDLANVWGENSVLSEAGSTLSQSLLNGFNEHIDEINETVDTAMSTVVGTLDTYVETFEESGAEIVSKLIPTVDEYDTMDLEAFGADVEAYGKILVAFSDQLAGMSYENVCHAITITRGFSDIYNSLPVYGENMSLKDLGNDIAPLGESIASFSNAVSGGIDDEAIENAVAAAETLAGLYSLDVPKNGGLFGAIAGTGNTSLKTFGNQLEGLGDALVKFSDSVSGGNSVDQLAVSRAANSLKEIIPLYEYLPGVGEKIELSSFSADLESLGTGIRNFYDGITSGDGGTINAETIGEAVDAAKLIADLYGYDPEGTGTFWKTFTESGGRDLEDFGDQISSLAGALKTTADQMDNINTGQIDTFVGKVNAICDVMMRVVSNFYADDTDDATVAINNLTRLIETVKSMQDINAGAATNFSAALQQLAGVDLTGVADTFTNADAFTTVGSTFANNIREGFSGEQDSVVEAAEQCAGVVVEALKKSYDDFTTVGNEYVGQLNEGMAEKEENAEAEASLVAVRAKVGAKGHYDEFVECGEYLVDGFNQGISNKLSSAYDMGKKLGDRAVAGLNCALNEASPSKEGRKSGRYLGEGLVLGMRDTAQTVYNAGVDMGDSATTALKEATSTITDILSNDMDASPTIRPVMDLSDVDSGIATIGSMFSAAPSLSIMSDVGALSYSMNRRDRGMTMDDVVSAIDGLRSSIRTVKGDTYNVNGVTYDDGSNISDAVQSIVRAARIERRA